MIGKWTIFGAGTILAIVAVKTDRPDIFDVDRPSTSMSCMAIDGDTLRCGETRVRLLGIDAAEMPGHCRRGRNCAPGDPFAQKKALARFARNRVLVSPVQTDRYGRTVAIVKNDQGENASCAMIAAGARYVAKWDDQNAVALDCGREAL